MDGILLYSTCGGREPSFLIAEKSWKRRLVGAVARAMNCIPVTRAQDGVVAGVGKVTCKGLDVTGHGTLFTKGVQPGDQLKLGSSLCRVGEVHSDTSLTLVGDAPDSISEPVDLKVAKKIDQSKVYGRVWDGLWAGGSIAMFPEGGSVSLIRVRSREGEGGIMA